MKNAHKIFFDFWKVMDNPQKFTFFHVLMDDGESMLIQNTLHQDVDHFIWISDNPISFSVLSKFSQKEKMLLGCYSDTDHSKCIIDLPAEYKVSFMDSAVVYESNHEKRQVCCQKERYPIQKASVDDLESMKTVKNESMRHNYIEQIYDAFTDGIGEVFVLKQENTPVSFLVLEDCISAKFHCHYKHISNIFTVPEYRERGFAFYLLRSIMDQYKDHSFFYVADSWSNTASNRLAKAAGFSVVGYNQQVQVQKQIAL